MGNELTEEPFRWDHRLFTLVLRLSGGVPRLKVTPGMPLPVDASPINAMCLATGGLFFCFLHVNLSLIEYRREGWSMELLNWVTEPFRSEW